MARLGVATPVATTPQLPRSRGPNAPRRSVAKPLSAFAPRTPSAVTGCASSGATTFAPADAERRLVENTGLEPVTSWLQTRRSPS